MLRDYMFLTTDSEHKSMVAMYRNIQHFVHIG